MIFTKHFTLQEFTHSDAALRAGISNQPPAELHAAAQATLAGMERIRSALHDHPVRILSGYRSPKVNELVGGAENSQHMKCEAVDFVCPKFGTPLAIVKYLQHLLNPLGIDQIILEPTWVHVSFTTRPRLHVLRLEGKKYKVGLA